MANDNSVHLPCVAPGLQPGGIWARVCTDSNQLLDERGIDKGNAMQLGTLHGEVASAALERGEVVRTYFYDGDSGKCLGTLIAQP